MQHMPNVSLKALYALLLVLTIYVSPIQAQTSSFTYQGRLTDNNHLPASGIHDFVFRLFSTAVGGTQIGDAVPQDNIDVASGLFTVTLDFGATAFPGAQRWLEISVKKNDVSTFTLLEPRQPMTSVPYTIRSLSAGSASTADALSAACTGCVTDAKIAGVAGSKVTGSVANATNATNAAFADFAGSLIAPLVGDVTGFPEATNVVRLRGKGIAATAPANGQVLKFNTNTNQYEPAADNNSGGTVTSVVASAPLASSGGTTPTISLTGIVPVANGGTGSATQNFVDLTTAQTVGGVKTFTNNIAGNITGNATNATQLGGIAANQYVLTSDARLTDQRSPLPGSANYIQNTTSQQANSNFNISGTGTVHTLNANVVNQVGGATGGYQIAGEFFLRSPGNGSVHVGTSNAPASGSDNNTFVGIGAGNSTNGGGGNVFVGRNVAAANQTGLRNTIIGFGANVKTSNLVNATAVGANATVDCHNCLVLGSVFNENGGEIDTKVGIGTVKPDAPELLQVDGDIRIGDKNTATGCVKNGQGSLIIGTCSSDLRFKQKITPFPNLLDKISRLQPVHHFWRATEYPQKHFGIGQTYGLIAQEVEAILPELVSEDAQGYKLVDYSKLPLLLLQSVRELKQENDTLKQTNTTFQQQNVELQQRVSAIEQKLEKLLKK